MKAIFSKTVRCVLTMVVLTLGVSACSKQNPAPTGTKTLENLQAAFNGESNASAKYAVFAKKADDEGYKDVAKLFRAAAHAESIHAANHAAVIKKMGGEPKADIRIPEVKTTAENLKDALTGETYEKDKMYPAFLAVAKAENNAAALKTFNGAKAVEAEHAKLYAQALANLEQWKAGDKTFSVCSICGNTVMKVDFDKCPVCFEPASKYVTIR